MSDKQQIKLTIGFDVFYYVIKYDYKAIIRISFRKVYCCGVCINCELIQMILELNLPLRKYTTLSAGDQKEADVDRSAKYQHNGHTYQPVYTEYQPLEGFYQP